MNERDEMLTRQTVDASELSQGNAGTALPKSTRRNRQHGNSTEIRPFSYRKSNSPGTGTLKRADTDNHVAKAVHGTPANIDDLRSRMKKLAPDEPIEYIDDPVFETRDAAKFLGVKECRMEKWRQRGQGPEYLFYDRDGVRYELSALVAFKAARRVRPSRRLRTRGC